MYYTHLFLFTTFSYILSYLVQSSKLQSRLSSTYQENFTLDHGWFQAILLCSLSLQIQRSKVLRAQPLVLYSAICILSVALDFGNYITDYVLHFRKASYRAWDGYRIFYAFHFEYIGHIEARGAKVVLMVLQTILG